MSTKLTLAAVAATAFVAVASAANVCICMEGQDPVTAIKEMDVSNCTACDTAACAFGGGGLGTSFCVENDDATGFDATYAVGSGGFFSCNQDTCCCPTGSVTLNEFDKDGKTMRVRMPTLAGKDCPSGNKLDADVALKLASAHAAIGTVLGQETVMISANDGALMLSSCGFELNKTGDAPAASGASPTTAAAALTSLAVATLALGVVNC